MIKNGKFYVAPMPSDKGFQEVFRQQIATGAGLPADEKGFPLDSWTPGRLSAAISDADHKGSGIDLRSIQNWFQDSEKGISRENVGRLARVFGCDDPQATSAWQSELDAARRRQLARRRDKNVKIKNGYGEGPALEAVPKTGKSLGHRRVSLAERGERFLSGEAAVNLLVGYWLVYCGLGLMNYVLGTLSITYSPVEGLDTQVGFIWAPTLTALPLIVLPAYIFFVSELNTYWKNIGRGLCEGDKILAREPRLVNPWISKVKSFNFSFWAIALFGVFFVFGFQWGAIYLPAYMSGDANGVQIDRYLVALYKPEVISVSNAMLLSFVGYIYTASYIAVFMAGLLFQVVVVLDYYDLSSDVDSENEASISRQIRKEGQKVVWGSYRIAVFGLWLAILLKLQITYLSSDASNFISWIATDALGAVGLTESRNGFLNNTTVTHFTTFLMMVVTVSVLIFCIAKVHGTFNRLELYCGDFSFSRDGFAVTRMIAVVALLSLNLVGVGQFLGFSLYVALSVLASCHVLSGPKLRKY